MKREFQAWTKSREEAQAAAQEVAPEPAADPEPPVEEKPKPRATRSRKTA